MGDAQTDTAQQNGAPPPEVVAEIKKVLRPVPRRQLEAKAKELGIDISECKTKPAIVEKMAADPRMAQTPDLILVHVARTPGGGVETSVSTQGNIDPLAVGDLLTLARNGYREKLGLGG